jgi:uncharacterized protein YjdB
MRVVSILLGLCFSVIMNATPAGLVAAYNFNEGSGSAVTDASGNGNTGTISGAAWTTSGKFGGALSFNGTNSWITVNDAVSLDLTSGVTMEAWVKLSTVTGWQAIVIKERPAGLSYALYAANTDHNAAVAALHTSNDVNLYGNSALAVNTWTHVAATYDGTTLRLYVNGVQVNSQALSGSIPVSPSPLRIGGDSVWGEYLNGVIDEVRVYNRALSAAEIQTDMNAPINAAPQTGLTVAPGTFTLTTLAGIQQLTATATYLDGSTQNVTSNAGTSYSSSNAAVATVNATGQVKAVANGTATITPTYGGFSATATATVNIPPPVQTGVTLTPASFTLTAIGAMQQLTVTATYSDGSTQNVTNNATTTYSSNNTAVVTVNTTGSVKAVAAGSATIQATYGGFSGNATATVNTTPPPTGLVAAYAFNEGVGNTVTDASGHGNTGTISGATWTASGKFGGALSFNGSSSWVTVNDAASIDLTNGVTLEAWVKLSTVTGWQAVVIKERPGGLIYALYAANTNQSGPVAALHTSSDTNLYGPPPLPVNTWAHVAATYDGATLRLYVNGVQVNSQAFSGQMPLSASPLRIGGDSVWGEYFNGAIDEVRVYNRALSAAEIQTDMNTPITTAPQNGLTLIPASCTLTTFGGTQQLTATATYSDGSTQNVTSNAGTSYTSNNTAVATVNATGQIKAVANGTATITSSYGGFSANATATVNIPPPVQTGLTLTPTSFTLTTIGAMQQLTVMATYSDGSTQNVTSNAGTSDTSNNTAVATVNTTGQVKAVANGTATIKASFGGFSANSVATVNTTAPAQTGLTTAPGSFTLTALGVVQQLKVIATYSDGSTQDVTSNTSTSYTSNNTAVATVNATGQVKAVANGTATIQASFGGFSANSTATVNTTVGPPGLVAAYNFNEGSGTTANDVSGNANTGTISGATWTNSGRFGSALSFNGTNSWVTVNDSPSLDLTTGVTVEAWVSPRAPLGWQAAVIKEQAIDLVYGLYVNTSQDQAAGTMNIGGNDIAVNYAAEDSQVPMNTWTHLATTFDGSTLRLYEDAVQVNSVVASGKMPIAAGPLRIGGDAVWGEYFNGLIDEVRIYNRALSPAEIAADMNAPINPPMLTGITVTPTNFTMPVVGATQQLTTTGTYTGGLVQNVTLNTGITYTSSNPAVAKVSATGIVTAIANGMATITVSYNGFSPTITATVAIASDPSQVGQWSQPFDMGVVAVNLVLLRTGKVLLYGGPLASGQAARLYDPATGNVKQVPNNLTDIFCSGHVALADGRILVVGGYDAKNNITGVADVNIFDPGTEQWTSGPKMTYRRWYPTATELSDGRVLVTSGAQTCWAYECLANTPEIYNPSTNAWTQLTLGQLPYWYYPLAFLLPDGRVLFNGSSEQPTVTRAFNVGTQSWTTIDTSLADGGSAVMYTPGKFMKSGTSSDAGGPNVPASNTTYVLDMTTPLPIWQQTAPMASPRAFHNLTVLPDGAVLATGGEQTTDGSSIPNAVYQAELWSPATQTWKTLSLEQVPRLYHSTAVLMPDARVLVAGGGSVYPAADETTGEYFSPPYLFKGLRPTITSAPANISYANNFAIQTPNAADIASIALIRLGATTHQFNEDQHFVNLTFQNLGGSLTVQGPGNANLAPPGYYMLFIVNTNGVPSVAPIVQLR